MELIMFSFFGIWCCRIALHYTEMSFSINWQLSEDMCTMCANKFVFLKDKHIENKANPTLRRKGIL